LAVRARKTNTCSAEDFFRSLLALKLELAEDEITEESTLPVEPDLAFEIAMLIGAHGITNHKCIMASDCRTVGNIVRLLSS
jgi:hypothetical protein